MQDETPAPASIIEDAVMIVLSLISVLLLFFEIFADHSPHQSRALDAADITIASVFLGEFCIRLYRAPDRRRFMKHHWWELLASIPINSQATQLLRSLNLLRIVRLIRLLRLIRFLVRVRVILNASARFAEQTYLVYVVTLAGLVIAGGALGFHYMEAGSNPTVHGLWDSVWWAATTVTTVGYGDVYPRTTGGRILAIFLMIGGIATFSAATALISAYLVRNKQD